MRTSPCGEPRSWLIAFFRRLRFIEERQAMTMERLACFSERETPRVVRLMRHAELALQRSDAAAKLRRLQAQRLRRRRIGAEIGDLGEEIEVVEVSNWGHGAAPNYSIHDKYAFHFGICPADHCAASLAARA